MSPQRGPIPLEALPPGWRPAEVDDELLVYRRNEPRVEIVADRTEAERAHPGLGLGQYWELRYRYLVGEQSARKSIGRVSTRQAALRGILECMTQIHERVDDLSDPHEICVALEDVSLNSVVPEYGENVLGNKL